MIAMKSTTRIIPMLLALLALAGCGSAKQAAESAAKPAATATASSQGQVSPLGSIANTFGSWTTLKAGGNVGISGGKSLSSNMQVRMQRGKSIFISVRPMGLVEVARLVITGDTLLVVDKIHKRYIQEKVSLITGGIPVTVSTMQDLMLGRAFVLGQGTLSPSTTGQVTLANLNGTLQVKPKQSYNGYEYGFNFNSNHQIVSAWVAPVNAAQGQSAYKLSYADVKKTVAGNVAGSIGATSQINKKDFSLKLSYSSLAWNEEVTVDTKIPAGYTRVAGDKLLNMLGQ